VTHQAERNVSTRGDGDLVDLSDAVRDVIRASGVQCGLCSVHVAGSTAAVTTIEYEPGLLKDFPAALEKIASRELEYEHNRRWGDGNGFSHVRASLLGPDLIIPVSGGGPLLGTWQQPVLVECDNRARQRTVHFTVVGE
jgi:secondary thiamine-phosphate synthase enzyme